MNNEDYNELFRFMRTQVVERGFGALDERIISNMRDSNGAFWDLLYYLKHLREEIHLGSDAQYRETLRRMRKYVRTESLNPMVGIKIQLSLEDSERYGVHELEIAPSRELSQISEEIGTLIEALNADRDHGSK